MRIKLLLALLWPALAMSQEVKPVLSVDYLLLIQNDSVSNVKNSITVDSTNSMKLSKLRFIPSLSNGQLLVKKITVKSDNTVNLKYVGNDYISITGSASASIERQHINRVPATQNQFVQGRSSGNALIWNGPETGELFSYGPAIATLEYDGNSNANDVNGNLVPSGTGNGIKADVYDNNILRNATLISNALTMNAKYYRDYQHVIGLSIKAGQGRQHTFITTNKNATNHFSAKAEAVLKSFSINGSYNYRQEKFTHNNRNGFLNRVYLSSMLTPVTFDIRQGNMIGSKQRSYSTYADNPLFLLSNPEHGFLQQQHTANISVTQKFKNLQLKLSQSIENLNQNSNEGYQPGTAFFQDGIIVNRTKNDDSYLLHANAVYNIPTESYRYKLQATANYFYSNKHSVIDYNIHSPAYDYKRSSHDVAVSFSQEYNGQNIDARLLLSNNIYSSNTSNRRTFFLPGILGYTRFNNLFDANNLSVKFSGSFTKFNSELPIDKSLANSSMVNIGVPNAQQYQPLTEVITYNNLNPVQHREYSGGIEVQYKSKISFAANYFNRTKVDDIFPVMISDKMNLLNMATHRQSGIEMELAFNPYRWNQNKLNYNNSISFVAYKSKVLAVNDGYNYTPIAGFKEVHKALVKGEVLGAIVGNTWLRNADNKIVIGADGFPLVNNLLSVIGNPIPDFTIKFNQRFSYKTKWHLNIDCEWRKGGDIWNGTQALLDYYGRSATTATLRNTTGYVFDGVAPNGNHNSIPVDFYNPTLAIEQNRWVRYGHSGVAESYIQKGDCIRLNNIGIVYKQAIKKYLHQMVFSLYAGNIILWSPYSGTDPNQLLNDQSGSSGLDFFNLPSTHSYGFSVSLQF
jgi:hypothetical protein